MARILVYTSPARGHLYPLIPTITELRRRGHDVRVRTLASEVATLQAMDIHASAIDARVEARQIDDWKASSPPQALMAACRTFADRGQFEVEELTTAIADERPDLLLVDVNSWGAAAVAETAGVPWATFAPYLLPIRAPGIPPWGLGLAPMSGVIGAMRDAVLWTVVNALYDRALPQLNAVRARVGAPPLRHVADLPRRSPCIIALTAEPFEYPRAWPASVHLVGPGVWEPPSDATLAHDPRPLVLVTCSTEFQNDASLVHVALDALADEPVRVIATTASNEPAQFSVPANATVAQYLPHGPLLREAACVICHGGMGITQKALTHGVPVCVVAYGRDQVEVGRHVEVAQAGVTLAAKALRADRLRDAVRTTMARRAGAARIAERFRSAGGPARAADLLERLLV